MTVDCPAIGLDPKASPPLLIIPAHNEARNLGQVLSDVRATGVLLDVLVVDDCSSDATARVAGEHGARVLHLPNNLGYGGAVQAGFRYATRHGYGTAVMMDADGQHDASCIADLMRPVLEGEADVVLGSRFLGRMEYQTTFAKRTGMAIFSRLVTSLTGTTITDPTSGFQALNSDVVAFFAADNYPVDFPDADTILLLHYAGFRVREVPVVMRERLSGVSMHSSWKPLYYVFKMFLSILIVLLRQTTHSNAARNTAAQVPGANTGKGSRRA